MRHMIQVGYVMEPREDWAKAHGLCNTETPHQDQLPKATARKTRVHFPYHSRDQVLGFVVSQPTKWLQKPVFYPFLLI